MVGSLEFNYTFTCKGQQLGWDLSLLGFFFFLHQGIMYIALVTALTKSCKCYPPAPNTNVHKFCWDFNFKICPEITAMVDWA